MQVIHHKNAIYRKQANFEEKSGLENGKSVTRPARQRLYPSPYDSTLGVGAVRPTGTAEKLEINQSDAVSMLYDRIDQRQDKWDLANQYADDMGMDLDAVIDARYQAEAENAASVIDAADFSGSAGDGVTVSTSNIVRLFTAARKKMSRKNIKDGMLFANVGPDVVQVITEYQAAKNTEWGDKANENGFKGRFFGFDIFETNNLLCQAVLGMATNPSNNDTVTIVLDGKTLTYTYVTTLGSTANTIHIKGSADLTRAATAAYFNGTGTAGTDYVDATEHSDPWIVKRYITATNDDSADTLTLKAKGGSYFDSVSETLTAGGDGWATNTQIQHSMFGVKGSVDLVIQNKPEVEFDDKPRLTNGRRVLGVEATSFHLVGTKVFSDMADRLVNVKVRTDAF